MEADLVEAHDPCSARMKSTTLSICCSLRGRLNAGMLPRPFAITSVM